VGADSHSSASAQGSTYVRDHGPINGRDYLGQGERHKNDDGLFLSPLPFPNRASAARVPYPHLGYWSYGIARFVSSATQIV